MDKKEVKQRYFSKRMILVDSKLEDGLLREIADQIMALNAESDEDIKILINSSGGDMISVFYLFDCISLSKSKVIGVVCGNCHSAAIILLQACHERLAATHSLFLFHFVRNSNFSFRVDEKESEIRRRLSRDISIGRKIQKEKEIILSSRTGLTIKDLRRLMADGEKNDTRLTAVEALRYNIIDGIVNEDFKIF